MRLADGTVLLPVASVTLSASSFLRVVEPVFVTVDFLTFNPESGLQATLFLRVFDTFLLLAVLL